MLALLAEAVYVPSLVWVWPFAALLLAIALFPLLKPTQHWWEHNRSKLLVSLLLAAVTLVYYGLREQGVVPHGSHDDGSAAAHSAPHDTPGGDPPHPPPTMPDDTEGQVTGDQDGEHAEAPHPEVPASPHHAAARTARGLPTVVEVLRAAVLAEYVPFLTLLFSLYVITGGIVVRGDVRATPLANTAILATGGLLASFIGTTGAAMVLIRFLLKTNSERVRKVHTVVFFIFIAANVGGTLLPIGDPPLFLGYLRGVDFLWTLRLWKPWLFMLIALLVIYFLWDTWAYKHESEASLRRDAYQYQPLSVAGLINIVFLLGVVLAVALLDPSKDIPGTEMLFGRPLRAFPYLREMVQLAMVGLSLLLTAKALRIENQFNYVAIGEVACLFIGIFITMQVPIEILNAQGAALGLTQPWQFFWATGVLSSFLDNAPTYVVYFETAVALPLEQTLAGLPGDAIVHLPGNRNLPELLLQAISLGAVFMGANTYIGNGPNFMVKAIAEQAGVKMPSFFGYMLFSGLTLIPLFIILTVLFFL